MGCNHIVAAQDRNAIGLWSYAHRTSFSCVPLTTVLDPARHGQCALDELVRRAGLWGGRRSHPQGIAAAGGASERDRPILGSGRPPAHAPAPDSRYRAHGQDAAPERWQPTLLAGSAGLGFAAGGPGRGGPACGYCGSPSMLSLKKQFVPISSKSTVFPAAWLRTSVEGHTARMPYGPLSFAVLPVPVALSRPRL